MNKQNCQITDDTNLHEIQEHPIHPKKFTAGCGFFPSGTIGMYFFKGGIRQAITVSTV